MCRGPDAAIHGWVLRPASSDLQCAEAEQRQPRLQPGECEAQAGQDLRSLLSQQVSSQPKYREICSDINMIIGVIVPFMTTDFLIIAETVQCTARP